MLRGVLGLWEVLQVCNYGVECPFSKVVHLENGGLIDKGSPQPSIGESEARNQDVSTKDHDIEVNSFTLFY